MRSNTSIMGYPLLTLFILGLVHMSVQELSGFVYLDFISFPIHPDTFLFLLNSLASLKGEKSSFKSCIEGCSGCLK